MSLYRRLARSKKGMSTVFGGLFFVILILMGFNVMLWGFVQYDAYNHVITTMSQRDQQAISENIVPTNATVNTNSLYVWVNNLGIAVSIANIYVTSLTGSGGFCLTSNPCSELTGLTVSGGNIAQGATHWAIGVSGLPSGWNSGVSTTCPTSPAYKISLTTSRGRMFSLSYPFCPLVSVTNGGGGTGGQFQTNIGPLSIYFDYQSFNFTCSGSGCPPAYTTTPYPAFCIPSGPTILLWIKLANNAIDSSVTLTANSIIQWQAYGVNGFGQFVTDYVVDPTSTAANLVSYGTTGNIVLNAANPNGPSPGSTQIVKFGATAPAGNSPISFRLSGNWIMFIGFYYIYRGQIQGETIPFLDVRTTSAVYPPPVGTCP